MGIPFTKMHGIGNDFCVIDGFQYAVDDPAGLAVRACRRRFGVGADGLMFVMPSEVADVRMWLFNADGSEAEMCGNGIRCAAKFAYDRGLCKKKDIDIETGAGIKHIALTIDEASGKAVAATVDMGAPALNPEDIPVAAESNRVKIMLGDRECEFFCVSTGVPHAVTFDIFPDREEFLKYGEMLEVHPLFPKRTNVDFARVIDRNCVEMRVWERGCGPTLACGTGSCAVLVAGAYTGRLEPEAEVRLEGGILHDRWAENGHVFMTGPAEAVFAGIIEA